jgi:hypothetical protein
MATEVFTEAPQQYVDVQNADEHRQRSTDTAAVTESRYSWIHM